jgi:CRP-like cAMP-binding protein
MQNRLIEVLPDDTYQRLKAELELVTLKRGHVLHEPGETIRHLYFPINCLVSITVTMMDGRTSEVGVVGNREVAGINALMGGSETTQTRYVVQIPGEVLKMPAKPLLDEFDENKDVRDVMLKYTQAMLAQVSQNAACNRLHHLEQRYARWLLEVRERIQTDDLRLTQEFAGQMLGVRRATVSETAGVFEQRGMITYHRGIARIRDAEALAAVSCECYAVVRREYDRLLGYRGQKN